jgi:hypothetical protein
LEDAVTSARTIAADLADDRTAASTPISRLDSPWLGADGAVAIGPLAVPSVNDLRSAFVELASLGARTRAGFTFDAKRQHWLFDPARLGELAEQVVVEADPAPAAASSAEPDVFAQIERLLTARTLPAHAPLSFERTDTILVQRQNHAFGDAQSMLRLPTALVRVAGSGQLPKWVSEELTAHPIWEALRNAVTPGHNPLVGLLRDRPTRGLRLHQTKPGAGSEALDWTPQLQVAFTAFSRESWQEVQQWRRSQAPQASMASVYVVLLRRALRRAGVRLAADTVVLYDCRRHLPAGAHVRGNFVIGRSQKLSEDPVIAGATIAETAGTAGPLATLVAATAKQALLRRTRRPPTTVAIEPTTVPAFVFPPRNGDLEATRWAQPGLRCIGSMNAPSGPADLTAVVMMVGGRPSVSITFHSNVLSEASMRHTLALMEHEAVMLLTDQPPVPEL